MKILLVSTMRDEGPHLLEWIAHHRALGVSDFLIYTNDCADGTDLMLDGLCDFGVQRFDNHPPKGKSLQWHALKQAWDHPARKAADWILCIDSDEFLNLRAPLNTLSDLINAAGDVDAIALPWRLFGHNGQARLQDGLTVEQFTKAAPLGCDFPIGSRQFKTIFRAKGPFRQIGVHRPRLKKEASARWADGSGRRLPDAFANAEQRISLYGFPEASELVQLNHYSVRSAEAFMLKRQRGLPNRKSKEIDLTYWVERNFNSVEDVSIHRHLDGLNAELAKMLELTGVRDLHKAAINHHRASFERLMTDRAMVKLYGRLLLAASSQPVATNTAMQLVRMYQNSHES